MIDVVIVEDHPMVRLGIEHVVKEHGVSVVGESDTGMQGVRLVCEKKPELVILDLNLPDISGLEVVQRLKTVQSQSAIIVFSSTYNLSLLKRLLELGIRAYVIKSSHHSELLDAVLRVAKGERYLSPVLAKQLAFSPSSVNPFDSLSQREMQTLQLLAKGYDTQQIAQKLGVTAKTVSTFRYRMQEKIGVPTDISLILKAVECGVVLLG